MIDQGGGGGGGGDHDDGTATVHTLARSLVLLTWTRPCGTVTPLTLDPPLWKVPNKALTAP